MPEGVGRSLPGVGDIPCPNSTGSLCKGGEGGPPEGCSGNVGPRVSDGSSGRGAGGEPRGWGRGSGDDSPLSNEPWFGLIGHREVCNRTGSVFISFCTKFYVQGYGTHRHRWDPECSEDVPGSRHMGFLKNR